MRELSCLGVDLMHGIPFSYWSPPFLKRFNWTRLFLSSSFLPWGSAGNIWPSAPERLLPSVGHSRREIGDYSLLPARYGLRFQYGSDVDYFRLDWQGLPAPSSQSKSERRTSDCPNLMNSSQQSFFFLPFYQDLISKNIILSIDALTKWPLIWNIQDSLWS